MNVVKLYVAKEMETCTCNVTQYPSDVWKSQRIHCNFNTKIFQQHNSAFKLTKNTDHKVLNETSENQTNIELGHYVNIIISLCQ